MTNLHKNREIPKFLLDKRYLIGSVLFILTFSILFMLVYSPFSNTAWFSLNTPQGFGLTSAFYIVALAILFVSKILMSNLESKIRFTFPIYIIWIIAEVVIISLFYTFFTIIAIPSFEDNLGQIMFKAVGCMILIMALPYTILTLYAAYKSKTEELQLLQYELSLTNGPAKTYPSLVNLYDYNGTLKLTINSDSLYYIESQDNYVKIYYENQEKLLSYMLRCRTKAIEENLADTSMVRCHRSFMVNVMKINHIKKGGKARYIVLNNNEIKPIPVSKSYFKNLIEKIDKFNASAIATTTTQAIEENSITPNQEG